ncbi:MAG: ion transporter [Bacteroidota bacterium]
MKKQIKQTGKTIQSAYNQTRYRWYQLLENPKDRWPGRWLNGLIMLLIVLNLIALTLETVPALNERYYWVFKGFELFAVLFFTVEYVMRVWVAPEDSKYDDHWKDRLRYMITPLALIDLIAIAPFWLGILFGYFGMDFAIARSLRLLRIFRLLKLTRHLGAMRQMGQVFYQKREALTISFVAVVFMLYICSAVMYALEHKAQPDAFSSIPQTMWWGVATLTTVGYGDVYPITSLGKFVGSIIAILGIGLFALPTGILASGFSEKLKEIRKDDQPNEDTTTEVGPIPEGATYCPYCGQKLPHEEAENQNFQD